MDKEIEITLKSLRSRHLNGFFTKDCEEAKSLILDLIPKDVVVGVGDSTTVAQIGVKEELKKSGRKVLDAFERRTAGISIEYYRQLTDRLVEESTVCDVFLTGTNAITHDGILVNVDAVGNRVAGMFWGHPTVILIVGRNKIVKNLDEAFHRIRNVIAPNHIRIRAMELGGKLFRTPCVTTGKCQDCRTRDRLCNVFTLIEGKPLKTDINIIIINEDLGLSWDESWPRKRITKIIENYKKSAWVPPQTR